MLNDDRHVKKARLHHKNLYLRVGTPASLQLTAGLDHFVFWGGHTRSATYEPVRNQFFSMASVRYTFPARADLSKTVIAFANDAGGEIYLGIRNKSRQISGIPENELVELEKQISNIIIIGLLWF